MSILPDANIWVSQTLHSWFGLIAAESLGSWSFYWTEDILAEALYHRRRRYPTATSTMVEDMRSRLLTTFGDNKITDYPDDPAVELEDINDSHVHNAAVHEGIAMIVTNDKGFKKSMWIPTTVHMTF